MSLGFGILGFLNYAPMTGYELAKVFGSSVDFFWHAQPSHIYLELKKLEERGLIAGETVEQSKRPNKRRFSLTDAGREAFFTWLAQVPGEEATQFKSAFLMKIFFGGSQSPERTGAILRKFQADCSDYLKRMSSAPETIRTYGAGKDPYRSLCWQFTAEFGFRFIGVCEAWAGKCAERLEALDQQQKAGEERV